MAYDICPNCGQPTGENTKFCANCGAKLDTGYPTDVNASTQGTILNGSEYRSETAVAVKEKRTKKPLIVLAVILALFIAVSALFFTSYKKHEYRENLRLLMVEISNGAVKTEQLGNKILAVWYNSIWQKSDNETDPYTKTNGKFNDNFNTSLDKLYEDTEFVNGVNDVRSSQQFVLSYMQKLKNPPKGYEETYEQLKTIYQDYMTFTQFVTNPSGSYNSYSEDFTNTDSKLASEVQTLLIYLE